MGVDPSTVHRIARGEVKNPSAETIFALARALEIDPSQIIVGAEAPDMVDRERPLGAA